MVGENSTVSILLRFLFLLAVPDLIHSFRYPIPIAKRFTRSVHLPAYVSVPMSTPQRFVAYQPNEYEETYFPAQQNEEFKYGRTPNVPAYGYFPSTEGETYGYIEEEPRGDQVMDDDRSKEMNYPYGQETFFEGGNDEESNDVFLQNFILDQIYRDSGAGSPQTKYSVYEDDGDRHWSYGIPVTEVDYSEGPDTGDESVKELESLREPEEYSEEKIYRKLHMQKKANVNSRKNRIPIDFTKKSLSDKSNKIDQEKRNKIDMKTKGQLSSTILPMTEKPKLSPKSVLHGQKEYVLPRPANPARRPFERVERASVYNTIKRLLSMEDQEHKKEVPRIQKRFILNEDQLTSQLSGLKKIAV